MLMIMMVYLSELFNLINGCELLANTSEWKSNFFPFFAKKKQSYFLDNILAFKYSPSQPIFYKTHRQVEKRTEILFFVIAKMTPVFAILPPLTYSFFIYFTTDAGPNAFILPPIWWAWACTKCIVPLGIESFGYLSFSIFLLDNICTCSIRLPKSI